MTNVSGNPARSNQSTEKALSILELLAAKSSPMRLLDIARELKLNTSTVARFLSSLQACGYVFQEPESQRYGITYKICRIANQVSSSTPLSSITHPHLVKLNEAFGEAVCVSVEQDMAMVYVDVASSASQTLLSVQRIGNSAPMHCTGNGKLLLATWTADRLTRLIQSRGLERFTEHTLTTREALEAELLRIRGQGYALDNEEREIGVRCLACPIRDYTGGVIAGISVTGPSVRMTDAAIEVFRDRLAREAAEISAELGYL